jgi:hypothetical protein
VVRFSSLPVAPQKQSPVQTVRTLWTEQNEPNEIPGLSTKIYWTNRKNTFSSSETTTAIPECTGYILSKGHTFGAILDAMDTVKTGKKGKHVGEILV